MGEEYITYTPEQWNEHVKAMNSFQNSYDYDKAMQVLGLIMDPDSGYSKWPWQNLKLLLVAKHNRLGVLAEKYTDALSLYNILRLGKLVNEKKAVEKQATAPGLFLKEIYIMHRSGGVINYLDLF